MPNLIIKPQTGSGNSVILQDQGGAAVLTTADSGAAIASTVTGGAGLDASNIGIKSAHEWRLSADTSATLSSVTLTNWYEANTPVGVGGIGISMTESSGIWTFPSTGIWGIQFTMRIQESGGSSRSYVYGHITTNNSTYNSFFIVEQGYSYYYTTQCGPFTTVDIQDVANYKVKFIATTGSGEIMMGDAQQTETGVIFMRLGDT